MSSCTPRRPSRATRRDRLDALAHLLAAGDGLDVPDRAHRADLALPAPPVAVGVSDAEDDPRDGCLHLRELDGDPVDALVGFVAPDTWWAFGLVAGATLHPLDDGGDVTGARGSRPGRRLAHLVDRHGGSATVAAGPDGVELAVGRTDEPLEGRVVDACRRVLGLSTAPPAASTAAFFVIRAFDAAVERAIAGDDPAPLDNLEHDAQAFGRAWSWERLRQACAAGEVAIRGLPATEAAWWDAGGFSRRAFEGYLSPAAMVAILHELLPPSLTRGLPPPGVPGDD